MKVFKFGGASINSPQGVKNITKIIKQYGGDNLVIVISAMGKMTNAFEILIKCYLDKTSIDTSFKQIKNFHNNIMINLFEEQHIVFNEIDQIYQNITLFFKNNNNFDYDFVYDQIVGHGEIISTTIVSYYFDTQHLNHSWLDARQLIKTDDQFRSANVDWQQTEISIKQNIKQKGIYLTQGFISSTPHSTHTTLGREGSDYSAAIFSYLLNAESMSIWKDVKGVLNADPRYFNNTILLKKISYREALEMAFYGASVIHPKTIKPLENKQIPLYVKSFLEPENQGTIISNSIDIYPKTTCYNSKYKQVLLSISTKDFSFMIEHNISHVFKLFTQHNIKVNLTQNTATSFTVCIEDMYYQLELLLDELNQHYEVTTNLNVQLLTLRHAQEHIVKSYLKHPNTLLIQQNNFATQVVLAS